MSGPWTRALRTFVLLWACPAVACQPSERADSAERVIELPSPAGPGSGEPRLTSDGDGLILSWLERVDGERHELRMARLEGGSWGPTRVVAAGDDFFVNWADFPSVVPVGEGRLAAHWLQRGDAGGYDFGVRVSQSEDGGATWSEPWTPHDDDTPTEHGFVSIFAGGAGAGLVWLDGRDFASADVKAGARRPAMSLRSRAITTCGHDTEEVLLDARVCDCCQTAAAVTADGAVIAYRDRSEDEIRDISVVRFEAGSWTSPTTVHEDGWHIEGCPVNGPTLAAGGSDVALAWFTGADDEPVVRLAFSEDGGRTFAPPTRIDDGSPAGRVDVILLEDGDALVSWLARTQGSAEIRMRRVGPDGFRSPTLPLTGTSEERASGFPQVALEAGGRVVLAWTDSTDPPRVRVATTTLPAR